MNNGPYILFTLAPADPKKITKTWTVAAKNSLGFTLGVVKWWSAWRRYCFFPNADTVYDADCLWDIADFCAHMTREQKENQAIRRGERNG